MQRNEALELAKANHPMKWAEIRNEFIESAQMATDGRPDYAWAQREAEKAFAKEVGLDLGEAQ